MGKDLKSPVAPKTQSKDKYTDEYGIERSRQDEPGAVDKVREKSSVVDHFMRMLDRYGEQGGNQFAAGITYFSVLAVFPLIMLLVAVMASILAGRPDLFEQVKSAISDSAGPQLAEPLTQVLDSAVASRGAVYGVGGLTALWSGLGWMNNLRVGISAMWKLDATEGGNFLVKKFNDLLGLIGLLLAFIIAFGVTAAGTSGLTQKVFDMVGIESFPGMGIVIFLVGLAVGLLANFLVMWWMITVLPRTKVPKKSGIKGALLGAVAFELIKQFSTVIVSSATGNPAGAVFGPIIALMVVLYLVWRVVLYVSAWTATTPESLKQLKAPVPEPAVIRVRQEVKEGPATGVTLGAGAAIGAAAAGIAGVLLGRRGK